MALFRLGRAGSMDWQVKMDSTHSEKTINIIAYLDGGCRKLQFLDFSDDGERVSVD